MSNNTFQSSFWGGFQVIQSHKTDSLITVTLKPDPAVRCSCGCIPDYIHDCQWRVIKEAMMFGIPVELSVQTRRINCPDCGVRTEAITWIFPYTRITNRLKGYIEKLLPIKHISELTGVHCHTIKEIDKQRLKRVVPKVAWDDARQLVMDEFAIFKGHRYATVIADAQTHQVLWIGMGRSRKDIPSILRRAWRAFCQY